MNTATQPLPTRVDIPEDRIADPTGFADTLAAVEQITDESERQQTLRRAVNAATTVDGEPLVLAIQHEATPKTYEDPVRQAEANQERRDAKGNVISFNLDERGLAVTGAQRIVKIPESRRTTESVRKAKIGWGAGGSVIVGVKPPTAAQGYRGKKS